MVSSTTSEDENNDLTVVAAIIISCVASFRHLFRSAPPQTSPTPGPFTRLCIYDSLKPRRSLRPFERAYQIPRSHNGIRSDKDGSKPYAMSRRPLNGVLEHNPKDTESFIPLDAIDVSQKSKYQSGDRIDWE